MYFNWHITDYINDNIKSSNNQTQIVGDTSVLGYGMRIWRHINTELNQNASIALVLLVTFLSNANKGSQLVSSLFYHHCECMNTISIDLQHLFNLQAMDNTIFHYITQFLNDTDQGNLTRTCRMYWYKCKLKHRLCLLAVLQSSSKVHNVLNHALVHCHVSTILQTLLFDCTLWNYTNISTFLHSLYDIAPIQSSISPKKASVCKHSLSQRALCTNVLVEVYSCLYSNEFYVGILINFDWYCALKSKIYLNGCIWNKQLIINDKQYKYLNARHVSFYEYSCNQWVHFNVSILQAKKNSYCPRIPSNCTEIYHGCHMMLNKFGLDSPLQSLIITPSVNNTIGGSWFATFNILSTVYNPLQHMVISGLEITLFGYQQTVRNIVACDCVIPRETLSDLSNQDINHQVILFSHCKFQQYYICSFSGWDNDIISHHCDKKLILVNWTSFKSFNVFTEADKFNDCVHTLVLQCDIMEMCNREGHLYISDLIMSIASRDIGGNIEEVYFIFTLEKFQTSSELTDAMDVIFDQVQFFYNDICDSLEHFVICVYISNINNESTGELIDVVHLKNVNDLSLFRAKCPALLNGFIKQECANILSLWQRIMSW